MKYFILLIISFIFIGCSAKLKFLDQQNGNAYYGQTGSTMTSKGTVNAMIENEHYKGEWVYSAFGGGFTIGSMQVVGTNSVANAFGTATTAPMSGNGLITMKGENGGYIRCVYNFSEWSDTGSGQCLRDDGKLFDIIIER